MRGLMVIKDKVKNRSSVNRSIQIKMDFVNPVEAKYAGMVLN